MATAKEIAELHRGGTVDAVDVQHHRYKSAHPLMFRLRKRGAAWRRRSRRQFRLNLTTSADILKGIAAVVLPATDAATLPRWFLLLISPLLLLAASWFLMLALLLLPVVVAAAIVAGVTEMHWRRFCSSKASH